jgi:hypothetical protein
VGHHARTLIALCALLVVGSFATASAAVAQTAKLRIETPNVPSGFFPRANITWDETQPITKTVVTGSVTCAGNSPVAILDAAVGSANWTVAATTTGPANFAIASIKGVAVPATANPWTWVAYVAQQYADNPCTAKVPEGEEVVLFPWCAPARRQASCFVGGPLWLRFEGQSFYTIDPQPVGFNNPVIIRGVESPAPGAQAGPGVPSPDSTLTTDGGYTARTDNVTGNGTAVVRFPAKGPHSVTISEADKVPDRAPVCVSAGVDGFCGSVAAPATPFDPNLYPSVCDTNGHDGFCGTQDTSGPVAHVLNITNKRVFRKGKGPGQITGHLDPDPNGVKGVRVRLTRVSTKRVLIKTKRKATRKATKAAVAAAKTRKAPRKRYRTVKSCTAWDGGTALLEPARCGTTNGKWFDADLSDLRFDFSYHFAMTLPSGSYVLEVEASDENGFKDAPAAGRNVLAFTVP